MSCVVVLVPVLTPLVVASWPVVSSVVVAAAASLGYSAVDAVETAATSNDESIQKERMVNLELVQSEMVTDHLGRDQKISVVRGYVTITFSRDARGKVQLCVTGAGHTPEDLRVIGEELGQRIVQKFIYQRLIDEMKKRQYLVVEEETQADQTIRLKVRHWEN
ncbi:MAG: hypothetical protein AAB288_03415 [Acidobacteriota bacterium]